MARTVPNPMPRFRIAAPATQTFSRLPVQTEFEPGTRVESGEPTDYVLDIDMLAISNRRSPPRSS